MTDAVLDRATDSTVDVMRTLARQVPLTVLVDALAIRADASTLVAAVTTAATAYPPGATPEAETRADDAVDQLVELLGGPTDATVARITLLVQACDATAGLIGNSVSIALHLSERSNVDGILAETLRYRPPVRGTRRISTAEKTIDGTTIEPGDTMQLDFDGANRDPEVFDAPDRFDPARGDTRYLTFGHGFRSCPGTEPALALAAGAVSVVLERCTPSFAEGDVDYERSPLRVPASLAVTVAERAGPPGNAPTP
jgi:cytochrome P450